MARAKISLDQLSGELLDFDIEKVKPFFALRGIMIPEEIKTKEELDYWLSEVYKKE